MPCTRRIYRWLKEHHLVTGSEQWRQLELWEGVDWSQWTTADSLYCASRTWRNTRWYTRTADWMSMEKQRLQVRVERSVFNDYRKTWHNFRFIQPTITYFKSAKIALIKILWCNFSWKCNTCSVCFNQSNITHVTFKALCHFPTINTSCTLFRAASSRMVPNMVAPGRYGTAGFLALSEGYELFVIPFIAKDLS